MIEQVNRTKETLHITRGGRPIAEVIPAQSVRKPFVLGDMVGTAETVGDIVSPVIDVDETSGWLT